jgi:hypothetical protein
MGPMSNDALAEQLKNINEKLGAIAAHLAQLNGKMQRHEQWIAAREQVCLAQCDIADGMREELRQHQSLIDELRGGFKIVTVIANAIGILIGAAGVLFGHRLGW